MNIGIDAGGTLIKIAYTRNGHLHFKTFSTDRMEDVVRLIQGDLNRADVCLTGGKAGSMKKRLHHHVKMMPEFTATCSGVVHLTKEQNIPVPGRFILANVGTGTSVHLIDGDRYERIAGSGVGGGTFVGLSSLLTGESDFRRLVRLSEEGERNKLDLLVEDIYTETDSPISGSLTASNFGKANGKKAPKADLVAAVAGMVAETVTVISTQEADHRDAASIVYIGSTFHENPMLQEMVETYTKMKDIVPYFPKNGEMSGALGALLSIS